MDISPGNTTLRRACGENDFAECYVTLWIWRIIPLVLLTVGVFGNILSVLVLTRQRMRAYSTTVFLLFLAVSDTVLLCLALVRMTVYSLFDYDIRSPAEITCGFGHWLAITCGGVSIWVLVVMTMVKIYRIKRRGAPNIGAKTALKIMLIVLAIISFATGHILFGYRIKDSKISTETSNGTRVEVKKICTYSSEEYSNFYNGPWIIFVAVMGDLVPMVLIIAGNIFIGITVKMQFRDSPQTRPAVKLLFVMCTVFVITITPFNIYSIVSYNIRSTSMSLNDFVKMELAAVIVHCLIWCNFASNFFFYFFCGSLFKREWKILLGDVSKRLHCTKYHVNREQEIETVVLDSLE